MLVWCSSRVGGIGISKSGRLADPSGRWRHYWSPDDYRPLCEHTVNCQQNCWHCWWFLSKRPVRAAFISWWLLLLVSPSPPSIMSSCLLCCTIARVAMRANVLASISQLNLWFISHRSLFRWHAASSSFHSPVALDEAIWKRSRISLHSIDSN